MESTTLVPFSIQQAPQNPPTPKTDRTATEKKALTIFSSYPHPHFPSLKDYAMACLFGLPETSIQKLIPSTPLEHLRFLFNNRLFEQLLKNDNFEPFFRAIPVDTQRKQLQIPCTALSTKLFSTFLEKFPNLTHLEATNISNDQLTLIPSSCPQLTSVHFNRCQSIPAQSFNFFFSQCPNLLSIGLNECKPIDNSVLATVSKHNTQLTYLNLSSCWNISDVGFKHLANLRTCLLHIKVSHTMNITDKGIQAIAENGCALQGIDLSNVCLLTDQNLACIAQSCGNLKIFKYTAPGKIGSRGLISFFQKNVHLTELNLSRETRVTNAVLAAIQCPNLRSLSLKTCKEITDEGMVSLIQSCPNIEDLILYGMNITDASLLAMASLTKLAKLNLSCCSQITNAGLIPFLRQHPTLLELNCSRCLHVGDACLDALAKSCKEIQKLTFHQCSITKVGVMNVLTNCQHLKEMTISKTLKDEMQSDPDGAQSRFPQCQVIGKEAPYLI